MIISTTPTIEGHPIRDYLGIVTGEVIVGANIFKDLFAGVRDIVGGRAGAYEQTLRDARREAFAELSDEARRRGADAVVGVVLGSEVVGANGSMLMVSASGTAVKFWDALHRRRGRDLALLATFETEGIFAPDDEQPCPDHDHAADQRVPCWDVGEGEIADDDAEQQRSVFERRYTDMSAWR